jgi:large subunit ribosomal protein L13
VGRLAVDIVFLLRGKNKSTFLPYKDEGDSVIIKNIKDMKFTGKKIEQKNYFHHTGYLGGGREVSLKKLFAKNPGEVLRKAVLGMLPKNKLKARMIKRLKVEL